jgi:hypothetical protein
MKRILPGLLTIAVVISSIPVLAASTNSSSYQELGYFVMGGKRGKFVYYKTGSATATIRVTFCQFQGAGCYNFNLVPTTQQQTYDIDVPFGNKSVRFEGRTDNANTTVFGTLTQ